MKIAKIPKTRKITNIDSQELKQLIDELILKANITTDRRLVSELITTSLQLGGDVRNTLNLKIASAALDEMRDAFVMFAPYTQRKK